MERVGTSRPFQSSPSSKLTAAPANEEAQQVLSQIRKHADMHLRIPVLPLLVGYRQGPDRNRVPESDTILALLSKTAAFQATDPRDKIYALESLLPRCMGRLIRVDYSEHHSSVFRRVTARCVNVFRTFRQAALFPLLLESAKDAPLVPSWVLDFTFSDADERGNHNALLVTQEVTLNGFLLHRAMTHLKCMDDYISNPIFATPTSLFCTGYSVDSISGTGVIEVHGASSSGVDDYFMSFLFFAFQVRDERHQILATRDSPTSNGLTETDISEETPRLMTFFMFSQESGRPRGDFQDLLTTRVNEIRGKTYFITATGLVGIATSPVQKGDSLALLHDAPIYFILRGVGKDEESTGEQKHQIIARAAIDDEDLNMQEWFQSFPRRNFHIV
ncbi:hypothetical protein F4860DRAFT_527805 [Xylaria cubensis]|nr:hypothetical protein F4860DRAFT_527805 [Xylaria cubensis]